MPETTVRLSNTGKPAPKWFRKLKKAIGIVLLAANVMVSSWGLSDQLLVTRLQLWLTVGIGAVLEAFEALLANGEEYTKRTHQPKNKPL